MSLLITESLIPNDIRRMRLNLVSIDSGLSEKQYYLVIDSSGEPVGEVVVEQVEDESYAFLTLFNGQVERTVLTPGMDMENWLEPTLARLLDQEVSLDSDSEEA